MVEPHLTKGINVDSTVDNRHNAVCSKHFVDGCPTFENPLPTIFVYNNFKQKLLEKWKTLIKVGQLISSVTLMNHFLKEQSLLNAKRIKPSYGIPMFLARLTSQTETQMKKVMKQLWEFYPTLKWHKIKTTCVAIQMENAAERRNYWRELVFWKLNARNYTMKMKG